MFEGRDPSCGIVNEANRAFIVERGPIRPLLDFPQSEHAGREFKFQKKWCEESQKTLRFASFVLL